MRAWTMAPLFAIALAVPAHAGPPVTPPDAAKPPSAAPPRAPGTSGTPKTPAKPKNANANANANAPTLPPPPGTAAPETAAPAEPAPQRSVDLSDTWGYSRGGTARRPRYVKREDGRAIEAPNPEGYYSGVSVEGNHVPPFPAAKMGTKPALLTWTGFERTADGSRVFFEVSAAVTTQLTTKDNVLTLRLVNTQVNVKNNARDLDLRYFKTPVRSVKVKRKGKDTIATIVLKRAATPRLATVDGKAGYKLVVLAFGAGEAEATAKSP